MKTIDISKRKFSNLQPLTLSNKIVNTEAVIYHFRYSSDYDGVLKKLYLSSGNAFASKLYTIEMLNYYRDILPESFVIPDALVSVRGEIVGFCMPKVMGDNLSVLLSDDNVLAYIIPTSNSDLYCYNIMVLNYLYGDNINNLSESAFYDYLNYLRYIGIDYSLLDSFSKLVKYKDNDNISCYLDSLSRENICRAKGYVYKRVLKK